MPIFIKIAINAWQKINLGQKISILTLVFLLLVLPLALVSALNPTRLFGRAQTLTVTTLYFWPADINAAPTRTFELDIFMETGQESVAAGEIHISFDKDFVEAQNVEILDFLPIKLKEPLIDNDAGKVSFVLGSDPIVPKTGSGQLGAITFKTKEQIGQTKISIERDKTRVATLGETKSIPEMIGASINILP